MPRDSRLSFVPLLLLLLLATSLACVSQTTDGDYQLTQDGVIYLLIGIVIWFVIGLILIPIAGLDTALIWWVYTIRFLLLAISFGKVDVGGTSGSSSRSGDGGGNSRRGG